MVTGVDEEILVLGLLAAAGLDDDEEEEDIEDSEMFVSPDLFLFESSLILLNLRPFDLFL